MPVHYMPSCSFKFPFPVHTIPFPVRTVPCPLRTGGQFPSVSFPIRVAPFPACFRAAAVSSRLLSGQAVMMVILPVVLVVAQCRADYFWSPSVGDDLAGRLAGPIAANMTLLVAEMVPLRPPTMR